MSSESLFIREIHHLSFNFIRERRFRVEINKYIINIFFLSFKDLEESFHEIYIFQKLQTIFVIEKIRFLEIIQMFNTYNSLYPKSFFSIVVIYYNI